MLMEVLNHSLDLWVDVLPQLLCPCIYMGKPSDRPEIPAIVADNLQVALPVLLQIDSVEPDAPGVSPAPYLGRGCWR
jgi:hypothetical protein